MRGKSVVVSEIVAPTLNVKWEDAEERQNAKDVEGHVVAKEDVKQNVGVVEDVDVVRKSVWVSWICCIPTT